jgi:hypothetical protein
MTRKLALLSVAALLGLPAPALATFHLMKIVEVFPGTAGEPTAQYVMLQMYFPGQNFVASHFVRVYDANGTTLGTFTFSQSVANGSDLATILIATPDAETLFGVSADLEMMPVIQPAGGAVCYDLIDCVAWGSFAAPAALTVPPDPTFNPSTGLALDLAMHRDLSSGGATTDFMLAPPAPENNAGQTGTLQTPTPTPGTQACVGDCGGTRMVAVNDLIVLVNIILGNASSSACPHGLSSAAPDVSLIIQAVNNALYGCPA